MALVADPGTLSTTAQSPQQATCAALKYILVDVLSPCPGEAGTTTTSYSKHRCVGWTVALMSEPYLQVSL